MENFQNLEFTSIGWQIGLPLILMIIDIITGYYNAWKNKTIKSSKMRDGIGKKISEICYIVIGFLFSIAFNIRAVSIFVSFYIVYMELMSIAENTKKLGVPMPKILSEKLNNEKENK